MRFMIKGKTFVPPSHHYHIFTMLSLGINILDESNSEFFLKLIVVPANPVFLNIYV